MVNWRKLLRIAPEHVEDDAPERIEVESSDPCVTPRPVFDDIVTEVAAMAAPAMSWLRWRARHD